MVPELGCRSVRAKESLNQATLVHDNELYIFNVVLLFMRKKTETQLREEDAKEKVEADNSSDYKIKNIRR
ncbi:hypothetical protein ACFX15_027582 [Malus domestica]